MDDCETYWEGPRYTVVYEGHLFEGDRVSGINRADFDSFRDADSLLNAYKEGVEKGDFWMALRDNWYGVDLQFNPYSGEWEWS